MGIRSVAGIIEVFLIGKGYLDEFAAGIALPGGETAIPIGISGPKPLITSDYDVPTDAFNNKLRGKKNFSLAVDSYEVGLARLAWLLLWARTGGADVLAVSEGFTEYEGNASGVPTVGGGVMWRRNWDNGIFFFEYANRTHLGLDWEFLLEDKSAMIKYNLEAAFNLNKAKNIIAGASNNIMRQNILLPNWNEGNQVLSDLKSIQIVRGSSFADIFTWDEVDSRRLSIKTVPSKKTIDNRSIPSYCEVDLMITGSNASVQKVNELWNDRLFAEVRLIEELPNGTEVQYYIRGNNLSNVTDLNINKENRLATFHLMGQVSIHRVVVNSGLTALIIG